MGWVILVLVLAYIVGMRIVARRYFIHRHGVSFEKGEQGTVGAGLVGLAWPIALLIPSVRRPERCNHHRHILEHARLVERVLDSGASAAARRHDAGR